MLDIAVRVFLVAITAFPVVFYSVMYYFACCKYKIRQYSKHPQQVSVVIPAYNEEDVVDNVLRDLRNSSFPVAETIVLDDNSIDSTFEVATRRNVMVIRNETRLGKAATLNKGAKIAKEDIIVVFDADNRPDKDCIKHLLKHFDSKDVAIATGVTKISSDGFVSMLAALEFSLCFYLFQPFSARFNFFPILHGAYFGIRRELASFDENALTEDFDISVKMASKGYRIEFEPEALSYVSSAPSLSLFTRQRERWIRGAVQASFEHKGFSKRVFPHIGFLGLFLTALGFLLPLVWATTLTFLFICYFLGEFLLVNVSLLATTIYTIIAFLANYRARNKTRYILVLPFLSYFYLVFVVWFFLEAVVLEYFGIQTKFGKIPHK